MSNIVPSSTITLYRDVDIIPGQQIAFRSVAEQRAYFSRHVAYQSLNCTYVRKTGSVKVEFPVSSVMSCDYMSFVNPSFENIVFYAIIDRCEYVNNNTTEIFYSIDYFQTFCFTVNYKRSYIERQHLSITDWDKCEDNPFNTTVYEMQTTEQLPADPSMMDAYHEGINLFVNSGDATKGLTYLIVVVVSDFDKEKIETGFNKLVSHVDGWVDTDGKVTVISNVPGLNSTTYLHYKIPKASMMFCINYTPPGTRGLTMFKDFISVLTYYTLSQNVLGAYIIPSKDFANWCGVISDNPISESREYTRVTAPTNYVNKKLCRYPYSYITVDTPSGSVKEYHYEDFINMQGGGKEAVLARNFIMEGMPSVSLTPVFYKQITSDVGEDPSNFDYSFNMAERIDGQPYPQIPYTIDSYLTFLSTTYQSYMGAMTDANKNALNRQTSFAGRFMDAIGSGLSAVPSFMGMMSPGRAITASDISAKQAAGGNYANPEIATINPNAAAIAGFNGGNQISGLNATFASSENRVAMNEWASGYIEGENPTGPFGPAKNAYISDTYVPANTDSAISYYLADGYGPGTFYIKLNRLLKTIADKYDMYFSMYGYAYNAPGVPRICNYIAGNNDESLLPHWDTEYMSVPSTYVKTSNMIVDGNTMGVVEQYIAEMFNSGVRFLKGDAL